MISEALRPFIRDYVLRLGRAVARTGLSPNALSVIGVILNVLVAVVIATGELRLGGLFLLVASGFDMVDGAVARATGSVSKFGGFLDSTLDRYSEVIVYVGLLIYLLDTDDGDLAAILVLLSATGALLVSYARARAESAGYGATVGLFARTERVILLALALVLARPLWALWPLAILTHLTAMTRILHVWRSYLREGAGSGRSDPPLETKPAPSPPASPVPPQ
jgi:CDP-diacylglycerol--glycerol-3-phosphate 3-phosphatidyltransferase